MDEKGIIKFSCHWEETSALKLEQLTSLMKWRDQAQEMEFIGIYPNGIAYGNISCRIGMGFLISGSATGQLPTTTAENYSLVKKWDIAENELWCTGATKASSESLTHAIIYDSLPQVNCVLHIHDLKLWKKHYSSLASTPFNIEYGTPEMAWAVKKLIIQFPKDKAGIFLMQGHQDGLIGFGSNFKEVFDLFSDL
ncbi:MAG: class II aldolase/adducin family protein [Bacteroidales bacterium]|nr:class II aldolase/adducin family protein [Bacteroidales bacterium]